jgi:hypothetical protein
MSAVNDTFRMKCVKIKKQFRLKFNDICDP